MKTNTMPINVFRYKSIGRRHNHPGRQEYIKILAGKIILRVESGHGYEVDKILEAGDYYWIQHWYHHQIRVLKTPVVVITKHYLTDSGAMLSKEELL